MPTMWIPGIEPRSSDYLAPTFEISVVYNGSALLHAPLLKWQAGLIAAPAALTGTQADGVPTSGSLLCPQWRQKHTDLTAVLTSVSPEGYLSQLPVFGQSKPHSQFCILSCEKGQR